MEPRQLGTENLRQRRSQQKKTNEEVETPPQVPNGDAKHLDIITAHIQWKRHMEAMKSELLEQVHTQLSELLDKALEEAAHSFPPHLKKDLAKQASREKSPLQEKQKVFVERQSLLDELLGVEHFRTIYHMFVAMLCVFALSTVVVDFIDEGRNLLMFTSLDASNVGCCVLSACLSIFHSLVLDFKLFIFAFGQLHVALFAWLCMFLYTLVVPYKALQMWTSCLRSVRFPKLFTVAVVAALLLCHTAALGFYPIYTIVSYNLGPASRFIVILEQIRFLMKSHAFLRESMPPILCAVSKDGKGRPPEFSAYLYFLFCPTLIYRESYPRTPYVRWKYVINNFAKVLGCLFYGYFILERLCIPVFNNMSKQPFSIKTLVLSIFNATLPGTFLLLLSFFAFLHCWLNAFAEMLRFADRTFYKDWWNSTSFSTYYRTWNVVVHDWLYYYVYQEVLWLLRGKARVGAMLFAFIVSAVVHEYVFTVCFGFFYPVMFTLFAFFGVIFNFILNDKRTSPVWNVIMWTFLYVGQGIQVCLYCQEWYAQIHCPLKERTFWGIVTPRSWSCRS